MAGPAVPRHARILKRRWTHVGLLDDYERP